MKRDYLAAEKSYYTGVLVRRFLCFLFLVYALPFDLEADSTPKLIKNN